MSLMKQFPIDTIKIDRSFVRDLPHDSEDQAIAQAIISMGKALGMTVIAEGVETVEQQQFLRSHACDEMQGFLFSKPLPPRELAARPPRLSRRRCSRTLAGRSVPNRNQGGNALSSDGCTCRSRTSESVDSIMREKSYGHGW
jgi:predicted signal transduction protein with EAL and GGDEF domain